MPEVSRPLVEESLPRLLPGTGELLLAVLELLAKVFHAPLDLRLDVDLRLRRLLVERVELCLELFFRVVESLLRGLRHALEPRLCVSDLRLERRADLLDGLCGAPRPPLLE